MAQTTVEDFMAVGLPGQIADIGFNSIDTYINGSKQTNELTVTAANLETTVVINGVAFTANAGSGVATVTQIRDELVTNINAGSEPVTATPLLTDKLHVEADVAGVAFVTSGLVNLTEVVVVPNETSVPFGVLVALDNGISVKENTAHLPVLATDITDAFIALGVTVHSHANEQAIVNADNPGYDTLSAMSVMRRGKIYVQVEDAVTAGSGVWVRFQGTGQRGAFRSDNDGGNAAQLPNARFKTSVAANGIAILELNLP